jgi:hypothetical protein
MRDVSRTTPPPFMVIDVASPLWGRLCNNPDAFGEFMGWLIEEGFDPAALVRMEIFDRDSPLVQSPVWARVTNSSRATTLEALRCCPPMPVRMILGVYPEGESRKGGNSGTFFKNGHLDDLIGWR